LARNVFDGAHGAKGMDERSRALLAQHRAGKSRPSERLASAAAQQTMFVCANLKKNAPRLRFCHHYVFSKKLPRKGQLLVVN
jgi:hypothetical protein